MPFEFKNLNHKKKNDKTAPKSSTSILRHNTKPPLSRKCWKINFLLCRTKKYSYYNQAKSIHQRSHKRISGFQKQAADVHLLILFVRQLCKSIDETKWYVNFTLACYQCCKKYCALFFPSAYTKFLFLCYMSYIPCREMISLHMGSGKIWSPSVSWFRDKKHRRSLRMTCSEYLCTSSNRSFLNHHLLPLVTIITHHLSSSSIALLHSSHNCVF